MAEDRGRKFRKRALLAFASLTAVYLLLLIPDFPAPPLPAGSRTAFAWNQDDRWKDLEARFTAARRLPPAELQENVRAGTARLRDLIARAREGHRPAGDPLWSELESQLFALGSHVAALPADLPAFAELVFSMRDAVKEQSVRWDIRTPEAKTRLYRLLYGGRAALEGALLQAPEGIVPALLKGRDEPSASPSAVIRGVRITAATSCSRAAPLRPRRSSRAAATSRETSPTWRWSMSTTRPPRSPSSRPTSSGAWRSPRWRNTWPTPSAA